MKAKLICYTLGKISSTKRNKFKRKLLGYRDYSNKGCYNYVRKGMLSKISHLRPIRSVIIVKCGDESKIRRFLDEYGAKYFVFDVNIKKNLLKS